MTAPKPAPPAPVTPLPVRVVWWVRGHLAWILRDRWELHRAGWRKKDDGWWHPPERVR